MENTKIEFKVGDEVKFLRQAVGYPNVMLKGVIHSFNYTENFFKQKSPVAHIKAECEYGSALPYNNTIYLSGLTLVK
jgi:hypothetical protein